MSSERLDIGVLGLLPLELNYLIEPALKYGGHQFPADVISFFEGASPDELDRLRVIAKRFFSDPIVNELETFFDEYPITKFPESARLYFFLFLLDEFQDPSPTVDVQPEERIDKYLEDLAQFGSYRKASHRMFAARFLSDEGSAGLRAVPALIRALKDEDWRVQIWAHCALACIQGHSAVHVDEIKKVLAAVEIQHSDREIMDATAEAVMEKIRKCGKK